MNLYTKPAVILILLFTSSLFALEVDVEEIRSDRVDFINYRGPHSNPDSVRAIYSIGSGLGRRVKAAGTNRRVRYYNKYSVVRALSPKEPEKYAADIISLDGKARVNHIKNVRRIIAAYLTEMYGYNAREARALALFVTYYNAIHRGDMDYFNTKYKGVVLGHINGTNAGIARVWHQWPGKTKLIIPLTQQSKKGIIEEIDPFVISGEKTRQLARKDENALDERKEISGMKKRSVKKERERIEDKKKEQEKTETGLTEKEKEIKKDRDTLSRKKEELKKKQEELDREKKTAEKITDPDKQKQKRREIEEKKKDLDREKEKTAGDEKKIEKREETVSREKEELKKEKEETQRQEKDLEEKEKDLEKEKSEIEEDETRKEIKKDPDKTEEKLKEKARELQERKEALDQRENSLRDKNLDRNVYANRLYYLKIKEYLVGGHYNNEMLMIDPVKKKVIFKSPIDNICGQRYDISSEGVVVITHLGNHKSGHRLTLLDRETLKPIRSGTDDVFWRSFIEIREGYIYAIMIEQGRYYLGKYDKNLKLVARSNEWINENTFITFFDDLIYINRQDKQIIVLEKDTLTVVDVIKP